MANSNELYQIILADGTVLEIVDSGARELISALGDAVYWMGVTTTTLTDGANTNPITINGESVSAKTGGMAQYSGEEFVFNGTAWQSIGKNNFGSLAFKDNASATYQPEGTVSAPTISATGTQTSSISPVTSVGSMPSFTYSGANHTLTITDGAVPTLGAAVSAVTDIGTITASAPTFTGTSATITVS